MEVKTMQKLTERKQLCNKETLLKLLRVLNLQVNEELLEDLNCEELLTFADNLRKANENRTETNEDFWFWFNLKMIEAREDLLVKVTTQTIESIVRRNVRRHLAKVLACETSTNSKFKQVLAYLGQLFASELFKSLEVLKQEVNIPNEILAQATNWFVQNFNSIAYGTLVQFFEQGLISAGLMAQNLQCVFDQFYQEFRRFTLLGRKKPISSSFRNFVGKVFRSKIKQLNVLHKMSRLYTWATLLFIMERLKYDKQNKIVYLSFTSKELYNFVAERLSEQNLPAPNLYTFRNMLSKYVIPALKTLGFNFASSRQGYQVTADAYKAVEVLQALSKHLATELSLDLEQELLELELTIESKLVVKTQSLEVLLLGAKYKRQSKNRSLLTEVAYALTDNQWNLLCMYKLFAVSKSKVLIKRLEKLAKILQRKKQNRFIKDSIKISN